MKIELNNVTKKFNNTPVIEKINLTLNSGGIYCLLGRNGSGKSTIINLMAKILYPNKGTINIKNDSHIFSLFEVKKKIGLQSQYNNLIEELNTFDYLDFIGHLYKLDKDELFKNKNELINYFFDENDNLSNTIKSYSSGMKKKVQLCSTFLHRPEIVLLDEPFNSLDVITCNKFCDFIKSYINKETIIFICSHDLQYVEKIATNIAVLNNKKLVFNKSIGEFIINKKNIEEAFLESLEKTHM